MFHLISCVVHIQHPLSPLTALVPLHTANEEICKLLKATKVPYILLYKSSQGEVDRFTCPPSKIQLLINALHEHASPLNDDLSMSSSESSSEDPEFEPLLEEDSIESTLMKGSEMMDTLMPEIQTQSHYDSILSFEMFCKQHTKKK